MKNSIYVLASLIMIIFPVSGAYAQISSGGRPYSFDKNLTLAVDSKTMESFDVNAFPKATGMAYNFPNPFNPSTNIVYSLEHSGHVIVTVYDILGRRVKRLVNESQKNGLHRITWNGTNELGNHVGNGMYLYEIITDDLTIRQKMIVLR